MLSTHSKKLTAPYVCVSQLLPLLAERGKTQKELALVTGLRPERINRLARRHVVHTIVTHTAIKISMSLSRWPRVKDRKRVAIRLDALFPIQQRAARTTVKK